MERPSRTTAGGCAGKGLDKGPQKSVLVGSVSPFLNSPTPEEEGVGGESSKQSRSGGCPSLVTPPPIHRETLESVLNLPWLPSSAQRTPPVNMQEQLPPAG